MNSTATLIAGMTLNAKRAGQLAHTASNKRDRLNVWTKCGKRISTARLVEIDPTTMTRPNRPDVTYTLCGC